MKIDGLLTDEAILAVLPSETFHAFPWLLADLLQDRFDKVDEVVNVVAHWRNYPNESHVYPKQLDKIERALKLEPLS